CPQCNAAFSVADNLAGRRARCKKCGTPMTVPSLQAPPLPQPPPGPRLPPRSRRLLADAEQMKHAFANSPLIKIKSIEGDPPEVYEVDFFLKGLERIEGRRDPIERTYHSAQIK